mmetsp:Transcript_30154/g.46066  ORF Transcript_30154/g.46066 Transcript_30154/m.46066 type:complete len:122 (+) Transcript_30154:619-984(+)
MADKDFGLTVDFFAEPGSNRKPEDPHRIPNYKNATYKQLKAVKVINDYVFCSLLNTSRLASLDPASCQVLNEVKVSDKSFRDFLRVVDDKREDLVFPSTRANAQVDSPLSNISSDSPTSSE